MYWSHHRRDGVFFFLKLFKFLSSTYLKSSPVGISQSQIVWFSQCFHRAQGKLPPWNVLKEIPSSAAILNARNRISYSAIYYHCRWIYNNNYNSPPPPSNVGQCERIVSWRVPKPTNQPTDRAAICISCPGFYFFFVLNLKVFA